MHAEWQKRNESEPKRSLASYFQSKRIVMSLGRGTRPHENGCMQSGRSGTRANQSDPWRLIFRANESSCPSEGAPDPMKMDACRVAEAERERTKAILGVLFSEQTNRHVPRKGHPTP